MVNAYVHKGVTVHICAHTHTHRHWSFLCHQRKFYLLLPPPPVYNLYFTSLVPGSQNYEYFLFWIRLLFFNSKTTSPLYFYSSKNEDLKWYYKSFAKAQSYIGSIASFIEGKKSEVVREHDGLYGFSTETD